jgi:hypothetical protein
MKRKMRNIKKLEKGLKITHLFLVLLFISLNVYAAGDDPLSVINNLSDFIFAITRVIGGILIGFGVVQFGLAFKSQDPSQRSNGVFQIVGGVIIFFAKEILNMITKG